MKLKLVPQVTTFVHTYQMFPPSFMLTNRSDSAECWFIEIVLFSTGHFQTGH